MGTEIMQGEKPDFEYDAKELSFRAVLGISALFHVIIIIIIPVLAMLFSRPAEYERPKTFELVQVPLPPAPTPEPVEQPAPQQETPEPPEAEPEPEPVPQEQTVPEPVQEPPEEPVETKPVEEPRAQEPEPQDEEPAPRVEENLEELAELLRELPVPADISAPGDFEQDWYLNAVVQRIERHWIPPFEDRTISVVVKFIIHNDGSISGVEIVRSSGNRTVDNLAIRAVNLAAPFGRLPPGFSGDQLELNITLIPTTRN
ncbi:energy transducer TonB [Chitinispirillales bacterium ANBcel5]|uniref:energy transducer TonB n=1 Tax=Cellulosispirillum alkaliphilum TaxID=3039283 RepID=UPI002A58DCAF|nr:energy transducer TonB [Chitinispirillales bacterium ANBcel5]